MPSTKLFSSQPDIVREPCTQQIHLSSITSLTVLHICLLGSLVLQSVGVAQPASAQMLANNSAAIPLVLASAATSWSGIKLVSANVPWIQDREPADNPPHSRILEDNHTTAFMPIIGRPLAAGQASPTVIQVRNLLVEDHVLNGQSVVATLLLEPINAISLGEPVTVSLEFPAGVEYVAGSMSQPPGASAQISYNVATRRLTVGNIQLNLGGQTAYPYRLAVNALTAPINREIRIQTTASAHYAFQVEPSVLRIGRATAPQTISPNGGTYALGEGRVTLAFPPGAVTHNTIITGVEYADAPIEPGQTGHAVLFEVFPALTLNQPACAATTCRC